jgi:hypothetical protein
MTLTGCDNEFIKLSDIKLLDPLFVSGVIPNTWSLIQLKEELFTLQIIESKNSSPLHISWYNSEVITGNGLTVMT